MTERRRFDRVEILSRISLADVLTREVGHPRTRPGAEPWWPSVDRALPGTGKSPPTHIVGTDSHGIEHFKDFASGRSGTAVDVLMLRRGLSAGDALRLLAEQAGLVSGGPAAAPPPRPQPWSSAATRPVGGPPSAAFAEWVDSCTERLWTPGHRAAGAAREWLAGRGYREAILRAAKVGYDIGARRDTRWPKDRRAEHGLPNLAGVTFPMYGPSGELTYAQTRNLRWQADSPWPKYVNPSGVVTNPGVAYWRERGVRAGAPVIVVEGPTDALAIRQAGYDVVALIGAGQAANPATVAWLVESFSLDRPYVIMTDPDDAGRFAADLLAGHLAAHGAIVVRLSPEGGEDVADWARSATSDPSHLLDQGLVATFQTATAEVHRSLNGRAVGDGDSDLPRPAPKPLGLKSACRGVRTALQVGGAQ